MKKVFLLLSVLFFVCCTKEQLEFDGNEYMDDMYYYASIHLCGDIEISTSPLTKGAVSDNRYYAFEIDSIGVVMPAPGVYDSVPYHYAEGIFDGNNISNLKIALERNHKYIIKCSVVEDGEETVFVKDNYLQEPFASSVYSYGSKAKISNNFIYDSEKTIYAYNTMNVVRVDDGSSNGVSKQNALVNRYYGEVVNDGNMTIKINLERRNFGLRFKLKAPEEGTLKVYMDYGNPKFEYILTSSSEDIDEEHIYSLDLVNDFATIRANVQWIDKDGRVIDLSPNKFKAYNKTITTIDVDLSDRINSENYNSGIEMVIDRGMEAGDSYIIN